MADVLLDLPEPEPLGPLETVCPECWVTYHRPLGACPDKDRHRD